MIFLKPTPHPNSILKLKQNDRPEYGASSHAHGIYSISPANLIQSNNLKKAKLVAWRYFGKDSKGRFGVDEVRIGSRSTIHIYNGFHYGEWVQEHRNLLDELNAKPELKYYEHTLLRLNYIKIKAIWFKNTKGLPDFFFPLSPRFYNLEKKLYTEKEFIPILVEATKSQLSHINDGIDPLSGG